MDNPGPTTEMGQAHITKMVPRDYSYVWCTVQDGVDHKIYGGLVLGYDVCHVQTTLDYSR